MLKKGAFERSQAFHREQLAKHIVRSGYDSQIKSEYHARVAQLQDRSGRIIPLNERKVLYANEHNRIYGGTKDEMPCKYSDWQKIVRKYR
ncbi:MAG: hypothetical protein IJY01_03740 [Clostridia bacterium]|nr:hypothetical protein [Clostridia bacterium]